MALDYGRDVFAVPGQVDSSKSEGTHWLLQQGAKLVQRVEDIVVELDLHCGSDSHMQKAVTPVEHIDMEPDALALLACIEPYPLMRETLFEKTGLSPARMSELLLMLELDGFIEMLPGDLLRKTSG
jgi:DNA processing protein